MKSYIKTIFIQTKLLLICNSYSEFRIVYYEYYHELFIEIYYMKYIISIYLSRIRRKEENIDYTRIKSMRFLISF